MSGTGKADNGFKHGLFRKYIYLTVGGCLFATGVTMGLVGANIPLNICHINGGAHNLHLFESARTLTCTFKNQFLENDLSLHASFFDINGTGVEFYPLSNEASAMPVSAFAPQNLQAVAGTRSVTLSWQAPLNDGGSPITNYRIFRSTSSGTETIIATVGNVNSYTDFELTNGVTYFYKIKAVNAIGSSILSNEASATSFVAY